jgi:hypothetical protein
MLRTGRGNHQSSTGADGCDHFVDDPSGSGVAGCANEKVRGTDS